MHKEQADRHRRAPVQSIQVPDPTEAEGEQADRTAEIEGRGPKEMLGQFLSVEQDALGASGGIRTKQLI